MTVEKLDQQVKEKKKLSDINNTKLQNKKIIYVNDRWELLNCNQLMMIKMG